MKALDLYPEINNCPIFCTLEYSPICAKLGNDLREFANKCELETTKCYMQQGNLSLIIFLVKIIT